MAPVLADSSVQRIERVRPTQEALLLCPHLDSTFHRLDARHTRYRFDLERDVPWELQGLKGWIWAMRSCRVWVLTGRGLRPTPRFMRSFNGRLPGALSGVHRPRRLLARLCR